MCFNMFSFFFIRVGHKGIMDLKYITPAAAGSYFTSHLPVLGKFNFIIKSHGYFSLTNFVFNLITSDNTPTNLVSV